MLDADPSDACSRMMMVDDVLSRLARLPASTEREAFIEFVSSCGDAALRRDGGLEHVTASCFVFTPDLARTLLCFHGKGRFWVQFGGHIERQDITIAAASLREAVEESGIRELALLSDEIVDLDRHMLRGGFDCHAHWDIRFVAIVGQGARLAVSDESTDLRWFSVDALPTNTAPGLAAKLVKARQAAAVMIG